MPHKHTRRGEDKDTINLPPSIVAKPLSTAKSSHANGIFTSEINATKRAGKKRKRKDDSDDTPKAFARLMAFSQGKKLPKGLDDGIKPSKKKAKKAKANADNEDAAGEEQSTNGNRELAKDIPTIRVGEKMSEFSARVDAALPVSGLINKTAKQGKDPLGLKVGRTKTEKRMHRMYDEWREQDKKIKEARQEALELKEEDEMEEGADGQVRWKADLIDDVKASASSGKKKGKAKKKKAIGEIDDGEDDPWAVIAKKRNEAPRRLNDVVLAPPTFTKAPKEKFKVRGARVEVEDVPKASGSLRKREELGVERKNIVESYRAMMKGKKKDEAEAE